MTMLTQRIKKDEIKKLMKNINEILIQSKV